MRTAFIVVLLAVLCASFVLSQEVQRPRRVSKYAKPCLVLCSALEEEGCEAKCKKPISYVVDLIDRDETESDGKFIDWLVSLFKRKPKRSSNKATPKPVPVDNDDDDDEDEKEPEVVIVEPPKPKRTITQEQIWEYFEKMYLNAELGGCKDNKCKISLPEVVNMKSDKFNFDEWLNTISTKMDQLEPFAKSYEKFLFGLDVPEDLEETIAKNDNVVALTQEIKDREEKVASAEEECKKKYPAFQRMFPEYDTYKERFCVALKNQQQSLMIALGKLHSTKESLMNGWEVALNARKQFLSVPEEFRQTWTKHTSLKSIVEAAKQAQKSTIAIFFNGDSIHGVQKEHAKSGGEEIYPDIIRAAKEDTDAPELDFDNANRNISNAEFLVELGAYHFSKILVQPNSTWFSKSALAQYKSRDEYEEGSGINKDYFFNSQDGALVGYPETVSVMVQPYISIAVSKTTEKYVRQLKRVAVFNIVFDASEVSSAPCASGNSECVVLTFKKNPENFEPLLFSVKNN